MIPKVIHYCWFGRGILPPLARRCIASWRTFCPDYKIVEWNEDNYDCSRPAYVREAYAAGKWAFVSDYARLEILYRCGGIYLDTDVELVRSLDGLLDCGCFLAVETTGRIATGLGFGAEAQSPSVRRMLDQYEGARFDLGGGMYDMLPCPHRNTKPFRELGFVPGGQVQRVTGAVIYPPEYFCPLDYETGQLHRTENTVAIHHFGASWISREERELNERVAEYRKSHGRLRTLWYKNCGEYRLQYGAVRPGRAAAFVRSKLLRRRAWRSRQL